MPFNPKSLEGLRPIARGEVLNPAGSRGKTKRDVTFRSVLMAADKLAGVNWSDKDYMPGASTHKALVKWIEADEKNEHAFWTKVFVKTITPPGEEQADIDFGDTEAAVAALMAAYIRDVGLFRKVLEKARESDKLKPVLMDLAAELCVFAVPTEAKEISDVRAEKGNGEEEVDRGTGADSSGPDYPDDHAETEGEE